MHRWQVVARAEITSGAPRRRPEPSRPAWVRRWGAGRGGLQSAAMDALLAFAAALLTLRLSGDLVRRYRVGRSPAHAVGRRAGRVRDGLGVPSRGARRPAGATRVFRVYYLGGALLSAALLGTGSLLLAGRHRAPRRWRSCTSGRVGVALAMPLAGNISGSDVPEARTSSTSGPPASSPSSERSRDARGDRRRGRVLPPQAPRERARPRGRRRRRPRDRARGARRRALAPALAIAAALLYAGFVVPTPAAPRRRG